VHGLEGYQAIREARRGEVGDSHSFIPPPHCVVICSFLSNKYRNLTTRERERQRERERERQRERERERERDREREREREAFNSIHIGRYEFVSVGWEF
jgi:hypothetical protein